MTTTAERVPEERRSTHQLGGRPAHGVVGRPARRPARRVLPRGRAVRVVVLRVVQAFRELISSERHPAPSVDVRELRGDHHPGAFPRRLLEQPAGRDDRHGRVACSRRRRWATSSPSTASRAGPAVRADRSRRCSSRSWCCWCRSTSRWRNLGLVNQLGGVTIVGLWTSLGIFMMRQFMMSIPDELIDAARIDGASRMAGLLPDHPATRQGAPCRTRHPGVPGQPGTASCGRRSS